MKTYFESLLFFFLFPLEGGTLELWRGKRANFLKKVKFSSLDSSSSLHSFLSLAYNDEYTRADDNKRKNTPAECEESLQQSKRFLPRVVVRGHRFVRSKRAGFFGRYFFFLSGLFERGRDDKRRRGRRRKPKTKISAQERRKTNFFLKRGTGKDTGHCKKRRTLFFRAVLFEWKTDREEECGDKDDGASDARWKIWFSRAHHRLLLWRSATCFLFFLFWKEERERKRKREVDSRGQKKIIEEKLSEFFCSTTTPPFFDENVKKENFFSFLSSAHENKNANCRFFKR